MTTRKCDSCKKILEKEPYYSIGEIEYTVPGASFSRLVVYKGKGSQAVIESAKRSLKATKEILLK